MVFRRQLVELLTQEPRSASSLARDMGLRRGDIEDELRHALRSAAAAGFRIAVLPAKCKDCGFTFAEDRLTKPSTPQLTCVGGHQDATRPSPRRSPGPAA
jgi:predicted Zn-ribbon and HTH transcriptional regulator